MICMGCTKSNCSLAPDLLLPSQISTTPTRATPPPKPYLAPLCRVGRAAPPWASCSRGSSRRVFGNREARILVLGLDNAGKTTILYRLQMGEVVSTIPTIGFNVETVQYNNIKFQVWDLGGQTSIRPYWRCYFPNTQAIIYVVDSSDTDRLVTAKEEFHSILEEDELKGAVVLVYANKQDLPGALDDAAITESLELHKIKSRQWSIFKTSAIKGEGLFEGLDWLSNTLKSGSS
ncbi:hypothetical protein ACQ4PT_000581 [Festuca glaucescens]